MSIQADKSRSSGSGISLDYSLRLQKTLTDRAADIMSRAYSFKLTHEEISESVVQLRQSREWKRAPHWVKSYIEGYLHARRDEIYRHHMAWMLSLNGKLVSSKMVDTTTKDEVELGIHKNIGYQTPWARVDGEKSRHVWKDADGQPMLDKPYDQKWR